MQKHLVQKHLVQKHPVQKTITPPSPQPLSPLQVIRCFFVKPSVVMVTILLLMISVLSTLSTGNAQNTTSLTAQANHQTNHPANVETLLRQAEQLAQAARARYQGTTYSFDQPLWQEALAAAEQARALDPRNLEVLAFLADTYHTIAWDARTREYWLRYLSAGGTRSERVVQQLTEALLELGFARYQNEDFDTALEFYREAYDVNPQANDALLYLARIHFELGELAEALPYWREAAARGLDGGQYFLDRTEQRLAVGVAASDAFYAGLENYQAGDLEAALGHFQSATTQNAAFSEGWVWLARTALELGRPEQSGNAWQRVIDLDPADERARYFLGVAQRQTRWGVSAGQAFETGISAYNQGDLTAAARAFREAVAASSDYQEARVWLARSLQESGDLAAAADAWQGVLANDPADERARYFLSLAQRQQDIGTEAGAALSQGIARYEARDIAAAEAAFLQAVDANPNSSDAWGWLGRIAFDRSEYTQAAEYYARALELAPDNESYQFFAAEAARLAAD
jgi:tetratricopeptide (TPR) repeat protein